MTLSFVSLFAGIGGFDLGLERSGMICRQQVEIDKKCQVILAHHWPKVEKVNDVKEITRFPTVDLVCGGFPCQDLSVAGRRAGLDGERSGLWFEFLRIIEGIKPQWVVIENVPGLLSSYSGNDPPGDLQPGREWQTTEESDLSIIFQGLAQCGYWWAYRVLDAQYWGVPQRRRRVFIVASLGDWRGPAKVLFESESSPWDTAPSREAGARVAGTIAAGAHPGGLNGRDIESGNIVIKGAAIGRKPSAGPQRGEILQDGTCYTLNSTEVHAVAHPLAAHHGRNCGEDTFVPVSFQPRYYTRDNKTGGAPSDTADITNAHKAGDSAPVLAFTERGREQGRTLEAQEELAYALTNPGSGGRTHSRQIFAHGGVRRFTPLECERLQGFPDNWTNVNGTSDSARYRMLGNAVAVPVIEWIGQRIMERCAA